MSKTLTIEDINTFKERCECIENTDKVIRFTDCYLDPITIKEGLKCLIKKINLTSVGIQELNASDKLLLTLIDAQKGIHF